MDISFIKNQIMSATINGEPYFFSNKALFTPYIGEFYGQNGNEPRILVVGDMFYQADRFHEDDLDAKPIQTNFPEESYCSYLFTNDYAKSDILKRRIAKAITGTYDTYCLKSIAFYNLVLTACDHNKASTITHTGQELDTFISAFAEIIKILQPQEIIFYGNQTLRRLRRKTRPAGFDYKTLEEFFFEHNISYRTVSLMRGVAEKEMANKEKKSDAQKEIELLERVYDNIRDFHFWATMFEENHKQDFLENEPSINSERQDWDKHLKNFLDISKDIKELIQKKKSSDTKANQKNADLAIKVEATTLLLKYLNERHLAISFNLVPIALDSIAKYMDAYNITKPLGNYDSRIINEINYCTEMILNLLLQDLDIEPCLLGMSYDFLDKTKIVIGNDLSNQRNSEKLKDYVADIDQFLATPSGDLQKDEDLNKRVKRFLTALNTTTGRGVHLLLKQIYNILKNSPNPHKQDAATLMKKRFAKKQFPHAINREYMPSSLYWDPEQIAKTRDDV